MRELFDGADANKNGTIDSAEVNKLLESVTKEGSDATALNAEALTAKVVAMEAKLDEVVGLLKAMAKEK